MLLQYLGIPLLVHQVIYTSVSATTHGVCAFRSNVEHHLRRTSVRIVRGVPGWNNPLSSADVLTATTRPWSRYYTSITRVSWPRTQAPKRSMNTCAVTVPASHPGHAEGIVRKRRSSEGRLVGINLIRQLWRHRIWNVHHFLYGLWVIPTMESLMLKMRGMRDRLFSSVPSSRSRDLFTCCVSLNKAAAALLHCGSAAVQTARGKNNNNISLHRPLN